MNRIEFTRILGRGITALFFGAVLASCGGGGGGDVAQAPPPNTLSGVAAVGYPIVGGTVSVVCAAGVVPAINNTSATGAWQVSPAGLTLPCAVQVSGGTINSVPNIIKYHSLAISIGTVNITPLTDLIVANFAGRSDPDVWFTGLTPTVVAGITPVSVDTALTKLRTAFTELPGLNTTNPITTAFTPAAGDATDDMLVALKVAMTTTTVTHTALLSNASLSGFTAPTGFGPALTAAFVGTVSGGAKPPVTGLTVTADDGQATISWNPVAGATSYKLYMNTVPGISLTNPANMHHPSVTSPFHHPGLTNGTTWYFVVTAVNMNGESIASVEVSATPQGPVNVAGGWSGSENNFYRGGTDTLDLTLSQIGTTVTGNGMICTDNTFGLGFCYRINSINASVSGTTFSGSMIATYLTCTITMNFTSSIIGPQMSGTHTSSSNCFGGSFSSNGAFTLHKDGVVAPTVTLTATPSSIASGATSVLSWSSTGSTSCTSAGGGGTGITGTFTTPALTRTTTYTVTCTGVGGSASRSATVTLPQFSSVPASGVDAGGCVQDNVSGLMWEVKTADGGLRDWTKTYTNYDSTTALQKSGIPNTAPTQAEINALTNSVGFKNSVNAQGLCGFNDWRLPTISELQSIVKLGSVPTIDAAWFPNTQVDLYWSASPYVGFSSFPFPASLGRFDNGGVVNGNRNFGFPVRLVRAGQ